MHRETVGHYVQPTAEGSKPAILPAGSKAGRTSQCAPWEQAIKQGLLSGLSTQLIYQDLVAEHGFTGAYDAVKRFVGRLAHKTEPPFPRMECAPGHEMQVDFGQAAWLVQDGHRRRTHLFRCVLSHSRKGYSEAVWRQTSESFLRALENAFRQDMNSNLLAAWIIKAQELCFLPNPNLAEPGKFTTDPAHLHSRKRHIIERGVEHLLDRCRLIGPLTGTWAQTMHQARGPQSLRVMLGLLQLAEKHPADELEKAAGVATHHGTWRLRDLKRLLELPGNVVQMDFLENHICGCVIPCGSIALYIGNPTIHRYRL